LRAVQIQRHLHLVQVQLGSAQSEAKQASAQIADFKSQTASLKAELDKAHEQSQDLQSKLDQANTEIKSTKSQLEDKQSQLAAVQKDLDGAKQETAQKGQVHIAGRLKINLAWANPRGGRAPCSSGTQLIADTKSAYLAKARRLAWCTVPVGNGRKWHAAKRVCGSRSGKFFALR
jgi:septal ring factor EnvC (AmiA/AmiB activator)